MLHAESSNIQNQIKTETENHHEIVIMEGLEKIEERITAISRSVCSVLVLGETGTGKEIIARRIHQTSGRYNQPFIAVNLGGMDSNLLSAELFGHTRGAFTNAYHSREGCFSRASNGTVFLDEIAELPPDGQVKLLRTLQDGTYSAIGSDVQKKTDARVIAATNVDIGEAIKENRLRLDLVHRFRLHLNIPPLRERGHEAIKKLAASFTYKYSQGQKVLSKEAFAWICSRERRWPGNVRQLESVIEMACLLSPNQELTSHDLKDFYYDYQPDSYKKSSEKLHEEPHVEDSLIQRVKKTDMDRIMALIGHIQAEGGIKKFNDALLLALTTRLQEIGWSTIKIAISLGMSTRNLQYLLKKNLGTGAAVLTNPAMGKNEQSNLFEEDTLAPLSNDLDMEFNGDPTFYTKEKQKEIVKRILTIHKIRKLTIVSTGESRLAVVQALVQTLENGEYLLYSKMVAMTGLNREAVRTFLGSLKMRIEQSMPFLFDMKKK